MFFCLRASGFSRIAAVYCTPYVMAIEGDNPIMISTRPWKSPRRSSTGISRKLWSDQVGGCLASNQMDRWPLVHHQVIEPFLVRSGLLIKDKAGLRQLTQEGLDHLNKVSDL